MTLRQFAARTAWPIEELESMYFTDVVKLLGIYSMGVDLVDTKTKEVVASFTDFSWRDE